MYAKLVVGATALHSVKAMRDIARLITSATPTTSLLSGFNVASSMIIDATPAGWTYVGSNNGNDRPTIAAIGSGADLNAPHGLSADVAYNLCFSAPAADTGYLKYCTLNTVWQGNTATHTNFALTGANSATSLGVVTNEGPRRYFSSTQGSTEGATVSTRTAAGDIIHLIATARHITIINENRGISAVWETSNTDVHTFYSKAPFIQYNHCDSSIFTREGIIIPAVATTTRTATVMTAVFNHAIVVTGVVSGTRDVTQGGITNTQYLYQISADMRNSSMTATGTPVYQVNPVFFQDGLGGYPTQYVSGTVPIYWTAPSIGTTGDSISIGPSIYTFFNCGTGFGVAMQTS